LQVHWNVQIKRQNSQSDIFNPWKVWLDSWKLFSQADSVLNMMSAWSLPPVSKSLRLKKGLLLFFFNHFAATLSYFIREPSVSGRALLPTPPAMPKLPQSWTEMRKGRSYKPNEVWNFNCHMK
jgi:hypothetical protein